MNVLVVHSLYKFYGGEDAAFASEAALLRKFGHGVWTYTQNNGSVARSSRWVEGARVLWSSADCRNIRAIIRSRGIDLVSVHNFFPLISPSVYYAAHRERVPVIQTLHNYRLLCPAATFLREGAICEQCLGKAFAWPAIVHRCYHRSVPETGAIAVMLSAHRAIGTWRQRVTRYIALTPFMRDKFIAGGFPAERIAVKPNSVEDTGMGTGEPGTFVFAGRLAPEKGLVILLAAWRLAQPEGVLKIIGTGPDELKVRAEAAGLKNVQFLGALPSERVRDEIGRAAALVFPSIWYEGLSRVVIEAFSKGTPVIASDLEPIATMVGNGSGLLFRTGDAIDLADKIRQFPRCGEDWLRLRASAREEYERKYTDEVVYERLMQIYHAAIASVREPVHKPRQ